MLPDHMHEEECYELEDLTTSFTFEEPGEYKGVCRHHGLAGMNATIVVAS
ncbi:MAG: hypothetical protein M3Q71_22720 [Chloroflexota bacterium]|nr:hypothetical protein [Chloroflexota bacterium]MDP9473439.1 hypothetical protein [Chloroflexota bacterium]